MPRREHHRPHDILVACRLYSLAERRSEWTYAGLAESLGLSVGEVHNSVERCFRSGILLPSRELSRKLLVDLLAVAAPRIFYAVRGGVALGLPTSTSAEPLVKYWSGKQGLPVVWECVEDSVRGETLVPLCPQVPRACRLDPVVYELMALVDVVRAGTPDDRRRASDMLEKRVQQGGAARA
jgi:hypothetical protein